MSLDKWFKEKWGHITTKDGKHPKCGRSEGDGRDIQSVYRHQRLHL